MLLRTKLIYLTLPLVALMASPAWSNGTPAPEAQEKKSQAIRFLENTEIHGSVDVGYNYNFNNPPRTVDNNGDGTPDSATNVLHAFTNDPNSFSLHLVELAIENQMADWASFRFDLNFGRDANVIKAFGFNDGSYFELQQAFVKFTAPVGNGLSFTLGKFVTLHGAELIESANNYNASRGLLFTWAIPFTHTGILMDYTFNDYLSLNLGVVNGWDNVVDNNDGKTVHAMLTVNPVPEKVSVIIGGSVGPEQDDSDGNIRGLIDSVITWNALENLTFVANFDLGKEEGIGGTGFANWWGLAGYAHWRATDLFGLSVRGEYFAEDTPGGVGVRTGTAGSKFGEGTATAHFYPLDGLDLRLEYRRDMAANPIFTKANGTTKKSQDLILAEAVYSF